MAPPCVADHLAAAEIADTVAVDVIDSVGTFHIGDFDATSAR